MKPLLEHARDIYDFLVESTRKSDNKNLQFIDLPESLRIHSDTQILFIEHALRMVKDSMYSGGGSLKIKNNDENTDTRVSLSLKTKTQDLFCNGRAAKENGFSILLSMMLLI